MFGELPCLSRVSSDYAKVWTACAKDGGLSPAHAILRRLSKNRELELVDRISAGSVLVFPLHHVLWMPNFQFGKTGSLVDGIQGAINELKVVMDTTDMTLWFCSPSIHLNGVTPLRILRPSPLKVVGAARAQRLLERSGQC